MAEKKAALAQAELNLRDAYVRAPVAGIIETRRVQTGQYVQPGTVLATLVRREPLLLRFSVPAPEAAALRTGHDRPASACASDSQNYEARITHVAQAADPASRMVTVTAEVTGQRDKAGLRPGAFAEVVVPIGGAAGGAGAAADRGAPHRARLRGLRGRGQRRPRARADPGPAHRRRRGRGARAASRPGELVVVRGAEALRDGAAVEVEKPEPAPGRRGDPEPEKPGAMSLTDICIRRPVLAWMIMAATIVFGAVAASRIGISQFPDVDFPTIEVQVTWEGASPEAIETDVVEIIEEALAQVEGITSISSTSREGNASITVELNLERNVDVALQDVQTKLAQAVRRLPRDIDPPVVSKTNPEDQPIMWVGLSGPYSPQMLADIARYRVKEKLQTIARRGRGQHGRLRSSATSASGWTPSASTSAA